MLLRRGALVVSALVTAMVLGCTPGGERSMGDRSPGAAGGEATRPQARWTQAELPDEALLPEARVSFDGGVLAANEETLLPHMVAGVVAQPGTPAQVRIWTSQDAERWETNDVPLHGGADAYVAASATDGRSTAVVGSTWAAGAGTRPFVLRSDDRRAWEEVPLPEQALQRAIVPHAVAAGDGALIVVGVDRGGRPAVVRLGAGVPGRDAVVDLPAPGKGVNFDGFTGVAVAGDDVVAVGHAGPPGRPASPVSYHSRDGGATWQLGETLATGAAGTSGVVHIDEGFVTTGWAEDDAGSTAPAAWLSTDGRHWRAEEVPDGSWLSAPSAWGDRVVAPHNSGGQALGSVMSRDPSGRWSAHTPDDPERWISASGTNAVAQLADGSVLMTRWGRNSGIVGVVSGKPGPCTRTCAWTTSLDTIGPNRPGLAWDQLSAAGGDPALIGHTAEETFERDGDVIYRETRPKPRRFSLGDDATIAPARWDPPASSKLIGVRVTSNDAGATAVLGTSVRPPTPQTATNVEREADEQDLTGWFRTAPDAAWAPAGGLSGPRTEHLAELFWLGDEWIAVGGEASSLSSDHETAAVWTSADGVAWRRQQGPFEVASGRSSWADGACPLPRGRGVLVVGGAAGGDGDVPAVWRRSEDSWERVDQPALGNGNGAMVWCAVRDDVAVISGSFNDRATLWRTTDGETYERLTVGEQRDAVGPVRPVPAGFAAAGTRSRHTTPQAVVWLSGDGVRWQAVPVPSRRRLEGADVLDRDGRLVVAATAPRDADGNPQGDPEVWILENPGALLDR